MIHQSKETQKYHDGIHSFTIALTGFNTAVADPETTIKRILPVEGDTRRDRIKKGFKSLQAKKQINYLENAVRRFISLVTLHLQGPRLQSHDIYATSTLSLNSLDGKVPGMLCNCWSSIVLYLLAFLVLNWVKARWIISF